MLALPLPLLLKAQLPLKRYDPQSEVSSFPPIIDRDVLQKTRSLWCLFTRCLRYPLRCPQPILQLHRRLRLPYLPELVRWRNLHRRHCG